LRLLLIWFAGWLWSKLQVANSFFLWFISYVGVAVYGEPQECRWQRLHFGIALFLCACFGVAHEFSSTRPTWLHAEAAAMWMWQHAQTS
jgi:hypothetical protein